MTTLNAQSFNEAASRVASWRRPLLVTHEKPDGDALGSLVAMRALLQSQGLQPTALLFDSIPARYKLFHRFPPVSVLGRDIALPDLGACDAVIVLDTCTYTQLRPIADWLRAAPQPKLAVDHHATRDELADLLRWVRPQIVVPVHGEALHLAEHAALARREGIGNVVVCRNGDLVRLAPGAPAIVDEVPSGRLYKDGRLIVEADDRTVPDRRRLGFAGIVTVALAVSRQGQLAADPEVELTGLPEKDAEGRPLAEIVAEAVLDTFESLPRPRKRDPDAIAEAIRRAVRAAVGEAWGKKPVCHVHVLTV